MHNQHHLFIKTKPMHDESLTSWINRLARENLCPPYVFSMDTTGYPLFNRDLDRCIPDAAVRKLSILSQLSLSELSNLQISQYYFSGIEKRHTFLHESITLATRIIGFRRTTMWTQFCPRCLEESNYYRKHWRYAPVTVCPKHAIRLYASCPQCGQPINFHRIHILHSSKAICDKCLLELTSLPSSNPVSPVNVSFAQAFINAIDTQWFRWGSFDMHSVPFINGLFFIIQAVRRKLFFCIGDGCTNNKFAQLSTLDIQSRHSLMEITIQILADWPTTLIELKKQGFIRQTDFYRNKHNDWPYWLWVIMRTHLNKGYYWITDTEIESAIKYLSSHSYKISLGNIGELLGHDRSFYTNKTKRKLIENAARTHPYNRNIFHW